MHNYNKLPNKQRGFGLASELVLLSTTLTVGITAGIANMQNSLNAELTDQANAIGSLKQSYRYSGTVSGHNTAAVGGSAFHDSIDYYAGDGASFTYVTNRSKEGE